MQKANPSQPSYQKLPHTGYSILILCQSQFGEHIDTYFYCKYLSQKHRVTYLCWDYNRPKQTMPGVEVVYVSRKGSLASRNFRYIAKAIAYLNNFSVDLCFIKYFRGCTLLRLTFPNLKFIFDIRTSSPKPSKLLSSFFNCLIRVESIFFKHITIVSEPVAHKFKLTHRSTILPLGSVQISNKIKTFENFKLLYIGTLSNRQLHKTIEGCALFIKTHSPPHFSYTIIGDGRSGELDALKKQISELALQSYIKPLGRIPFSELKQHVDTHNIGISFIPITPMFDKQPVTKTFDYILSGLPVIATDTWGNRQVITPQNGILIKDTAEDFALGLKEMMERKGQYNSRQIINDAMPYHWEKIVSRLERHIQNIILA